MTILRALCVYKLMQQGSIFYVLCSELLLSHINQKLTRSLPDSLSACSGAPTV